MICKKCGQRMYVRATVPTGPDSTVRTYFCKNCMSTADTHETRTSFSNGPAIQHEPFKEVNNAER